MKEILNINSQLDQKNLKITGDEGKPKDIEFNVEEIHQKLKELVAKFKLKFFLFD